MIFSRVLPFISRLLRYCGFHQELLAQSTGGDASVPTARPHHPRPYVGRHHWPPMVGRSAIVITFDNSPAYGL